MPKGICIDGPCEGEAKFLKDTDLLGATLTYSAPEPLGPATYRVTNTRLPAYGPDAVALEWVRESHL